GCAGPGSGALPGDLPDEDPRAAAYRRDRGADAGGRGQAVRAVADLMVDLDDTDRAILRALMADGGLNAREVGTRVGLSQPAAWRRIRRLEEAGVIRGRSVVLDREKLGFGVVVFLGLRLAVRGRLDLEDFERAVQAIPEVQVVQHVLGVYDYRLKVIARDIVDFERILRRRIMTLPGVGAVESNVMLSEEKA